MKPSDLIGKWYDFYGAVDNCFRLDDTVYECVEDECDYYRSRMCNFKTSAPNKNDGLYKSPIARVRIICDMGHLNYSDPKDAGLDGIWYIEDNTKHEWLRFGTNDDDSWYPLFIFYYHPKPYEQARHDFITLQLSGLNDE